MLQKMISRAVLMLSVASLCMVLGLRGMDTSSGKQKKPIHYYLEPGTLGHSVQVPHKVIEASRILRDMEHGDENINIQTIETDSEIQIIFPIAAYMIGLKKFIKNDRDMQRTLENFVGYITGRFSVDYIGSEDLLRMIMLADVLVATKNEQEKFIPQEDILNKLIFVMIDRLLVGKKRHYDDFLEKKGLLWQLVDQCPPSLQCLIRDKIRPLMESEAVLARFSECKVMTLLKTRSGSLAVGLSDGMLAILNISGITDRHLFFKNHAKKITSLVELDNGDLVSCAGDDHLLQWVVDSIRKTVKIKTLHVFTDQDLEKVIKLKDGRLIIGTQQSSLILFDLQEQPPHPIVQQFQGETEEDSLGAALSIVEMEEGQVFLLLSSGELIMSQLPAGKRESITSNLELADPCVMQKLSRHRIVVAESDGTIIPVEKTSNNTLEMKNKDVFTPVMALTSLEFLPNDTLILGNDMEIVLFDFKKKVNRQLFLSKHENKVQSFAVLPDGRVAAGFEDGSIRLFSLAPVTLEQCIISGLIGMGPIIEVKNDASLLSRLTSGLMLKKKPLIKEKVWSEAETWYVDNIFSNERIFTCFLSLPDTEMRNIMLKKGDRLLRLAAEYLFDELTEKMQDEAYIKEEQKDIEQRLGVVSRLLRLLEVKEEDELMRYYHFVSEHAQKKEAFVIKKS